MSACIAGSVAAQPVCPPALRASQGEAIGLVLSGGGALGLAHIGVFRVLDSLGVRPALVVGTSMGSLVGALYASGLTGRQIDSIARRLPLERLFQRYAPIPLLNAGDYSSPARILSPAFVVDQRAGEFRLRSPVAREPEINLLFNRLLLTANIEAGGNFDSLPRRFRAVATDMATRTPVVLSNGDLAEAVRASAAIPLIFAPVRRDGRTLVDGGLSANVPVNIARAAGAGAVIVSDLATTAEVAGTGRSTSSTLRYLTDALFSQPRDSLSPDDLRIRPEVGAFGSLDFTQVAIGSLIDSGYAAARRAAQGCAPGPPSVVSARHLVPPSTVAFLERRLDRVASDEGWYESVWLHPTRADDSLASQRGDMMADGLLFAPVTVGNPSRFALGGIGYDSNDGASAWLAAVNLSRDNGRVLVGGLLALGEWRQSALLLARVLRSPTSPQATATTDEVTLPDPRGESEPWSTTFRNLVKPKANLTLSHEIVRLFDESGRDVGRPSTVDAVAFVGAAVAPWSGWQMSVGPIVHAWWAHDPGLDHRDANVTWGSTINAARFFAPADAGPDLDMMPRMSAEATWTRSYRRLGTQADLRFHIGQVILEPRAGWGWGEQLPLGAQFVLGGEEGFPGLRTGERRGDRVKFGSVAFLKRLFGPVFARCEVGSGQSFYATAPLADSTARGATGRVTGVESGFATDTPVGQFYIGVGAASNGRQVFKLRLGN
jgi:predicted acylesterase/phospholipase RssA